MCSQDGIAETLTHLSAFFEVEYNIVILPILYKLKVSIL